MCQKMCSFLLNWYEWNLKLVIIALAMVCITRVQSLAPAGILLFIAVSGLALQPTQLPSSGCLGRVAEA